jgi:nicotinamidase-related amidase
MTSEPIRDPRTDSLLAPDNCALVIIDYQPTQVSSIRSMDRDLLIDNIVRVAKTAVLDGVPVVLSTVNVETGKNQPTVPELKAVLPPIEALDRTTINVWEDNEFHGAIEVTGRKKLVMTALWTEACLTFRSLDAMLEGYEIYPVVDAVAGTSVEAHRAALERLEQAGAQPVSWVQLICELKRDWARTNTAAAFTQIFFGQQRMPTEGGIASTHEPVAMLDIGATAKHFIDRDDAVDRAANIGNCVGAVS